jgi:membrane protein implicated in regulation of membrane protease activity
MFEIPVEDLVFVVCTLVGGGLLLLSVLVDDILGGIFEAVGIGFDIGGVSLMPLLLAFVSMFGVGGLFATQVLDVHGGPAAVVGTIFGAAGFGVAYLLFSLMRRSEGTAPFSTSSLVGRDAFVGVSIPAGRFGSVIVKAEGQTHEFSATASIDIPAGTTVRVTGTAGTGLIVARIEEPAAAPAPAGAPGSADAGSEGGNERG